MSRIRGIETRAPKDVLQTRSGCSDIAKRAACNGDQSSRSKDDIERQQISDLLLKLPKLDKIFEVHRKIGEGTFSSVYLGSLRQHAHLDDSEKRWFAIKHLVPTAHPARIEHELRCLQDMGGKDHVINVELCLRHLDTIVFIMPYIPHRKFSEYVGAMDAAELQRYMRALLTALRRVHSFGVIHRDVKPSNFLYEREKNNYFLVDFGLAQRICTREPAPPAPPPAHSNGLRKRPREDLGSSPSAKRSALDLSLRAPAARRTADSAASVAADIVASVAGGAVAPTHTVPIARATAPTARVSVPKRNMAATIAGAAGAAGTNAGAPGAACACWGAGAVCAGCSARPAARAPRAGTQGFRPPEVLLKSPAQSTAVDMWAAGVVLASALTARYPFFRAPDDVAALAELADLLGTDALQAAAAKLGRRIIASSTRRGLCLRKLCQRLRGGASAPAAAGAGGERCGPCQAPRAACLCRDDGKKAWEFEEGRWVCGFPDAAFALAASLLQPLPAARPSAAAALQHPFLARDWGRPPAAGR